MRAVSQSFRDRADSAAFWEAWVGVVLTRGGLYVGLQPFLIDGKDHGNSFDLEVNKVAWDPLKNTNVEVKSLSVHFTSVDTYPYDSVLVCSQNSFLRKWPGRSETGRDFLFVSTQTGSIVWLPSGSKVTLGHEVLDRSRNELYKVVKAEKPQLRPLQDFIEKVKG